MRGLTNYITESQWDDILLVWFVLVDEAYQALGPTSASAGQDHRHALVIAKSLP